MGFGFLLSVPRIVHFWVSPSFPGTILDFGNLNGRRARDALGDEEVQRGLREAHVLEVLDRRRDVVPGVGCVIQVPDSARA